MHTLPDPDVWQAWLDAHGARLLLYARQQTRTESDAEDVLQESLVESWERAGGQQPPLPLVFATIRRRAIDLARREDRRTLREQAGEPDKPWFEFRPDEAEARQILAQAVKELPEIQREVVSLKVWGGLTFQEIAGIVGAGNGTPYQLVRCTWIDRETYRAPAGDERVQLIQARNQIVPVALRFY